MRTDTAIGMIVSQIVAFFILIAAAGTLHANGKLHIDTAQDAAKALAPLGSSAVWLFSLCIIGTGLLAIPTLAGSVAYAAAETCGWPYGLYRRFSRAKGFYLTICLVVLVGALANLFSPMKPVDALVLSGALNAVIAPPVIVLLILMCNRRKVMGERVNGPWSNLGGWLCFALMGSAAAYLLWDWVAKKLS